MPLLKRCTAISVKTFFKIPIFGQRYFDKIIFSFEFKILLTNFTISR